MITLPYNPFNKPVFHPIKSMFHGTMLVSQRKFLNGLFIDENSDYISSETRLTFVLLLLMVGVGDQDGPDEGEGLKRLLLSA